MILTPYSSERRIDTEALAAFIDRSYKAAGWTPDDIDTGALIMTGEAARKENASAIAALFSGQAGKFVSATAGHHLEAILAAHGSGAVALSRGRSEPVLNIDIGGGTTKYAVCHGGRVETTGAADFGARVISWDASGVIRSVTSAGARVAREAHVSIAVGDRPDGRTLDALAVRIADQVMKFPLGHRVFGPVPWLAKPKSRWCRRTYRTLVFSGGVGEYVNGVERQEFGDLGLRVSRALLARLDRFDIGPSIESIRATCIGASQYTIQVSGDTLFVSRPELLPLRDLAAVPLHPESADAATIARSVRDGIARLDREDGAFALAVRWDHGPAYAALRELCAGIRDGVRDVLSAPRPLVVVLDADVAGIVGQMLKDELAVRSPLVCVDQIRLSDLDFIDIGRVVPERAVVPVVVKSLVFSAN